jgi:hypothetical protein
MLVYCNMFSYKKIDLLKLKVTNDTLVLENLDLTIKSPIINCEFNGDKLILIINSDSDSHNTFLNLCSYIERLFKSHDIKSQIISNNLIHINIDKTSEFYDSNKEEISKSLIKTGGKIICSFTCKNGKLYLKQLLQLKI